MRSAQSPTVLAYTLMKLHSAQSPTILVYTLMKLRIAQSPTILAYTLMKLRIAQSPSLCTYITTSTKQMTFAIFMLQAARTASPTLMAYITRERSADRFSPGTSPVLQVTC